MLLSIIEQKPHDILNRWKGESMLGFSPGVAMDAGTETILFHTLCEIFQPFLSYAMQKSEHLRAHWLGLVSETSVRPLTFLLIVP